MTGNTSEILEKMGMHAAVKKVNEEGIFEFCGMTAKTTFFGNITLGSDHDRKQYLNSIRDIIS
jgi:putative NADPH-quinone reductase